MKSLSERAYQGIIGALLLLMAVLVGVLFFSRDSASAPAESLTPGASSAVAGPVHTGAIRSGSRAH